jgi:hypothetical protein
MIGTKTLATVLGCFFLTVVEAGSVTPATARGFCNVEGIGPPQQQAKVREAGAAFFEGSSYLMTMLAAFEGDESDRANEAGSKAMTSFGTAGELYRSVRMEGSIDKQLVELNPKTAALIAKLPDTWQVFLDLPASSKIRTRQ